VIRAAEDRRSASAMIRSSIRLSLAGFDVGWMMNMSSPRTFSNTSTKISPIVEAFDPGIHQADLHAPMHRHAARDGLGQRAVGVSGNELRFL
jgi:hypothetical protein